jgi:F-type H+-transporting ATPase subunit b
MTSLLTRIFAGAAMLLPGIAWAGSGGGGMPQLEFGNPLVIAQVVWMLLIFAALYWLVKNKGLPLVESVLAERRARIQGDLEAARTAKANADAAMAAHRDATAKARAEAQAAIAGALQNAQAEAEKRAEVLNAKLAEQVAAAEARIDAARTSVMGALRDVATDTAEALVQKLIGQADRVAVGAAVGRELTARGRA